MHVRLALVLLLAVGCTNQTGIELAVSAPGSPSSLESGVASVEFLVSHRSFCERQVIDQGLGTGTRADVSGRDLHARPYELLVKPTHFTDLNDPVTAVALALDAAGKPIGFAGFGAHPFELGHVNEYTAEVALFARTDASYVHPEGCVCIPGQAWMGNGSGTGCDLDVVPSFDRFQDTAGCELSQGRRELAGPVCDGHQYLTEVTDRRLPCFNAGGGACVVGLRNCADHDGVAYDAECIPAAGDPAAPTSALCDAYAGCEKTACGDLIGCFLATAPQVHALNCTMHVDPTSLKPCVDGKWELVLPMTGTPAGAQCTASVVEGRIQPPLTVGFKDPNPATAGSRTRSTLCPPTLVVESIAADPALQPMVTVVTTVGDAVIKVNLKVVRSCENVTSSLTCG
jgi:hypothetical protein